MASLSYLIYQENTAGEDDTRGAQKPETLSSAGDRSHTVFSSFQKKSVIVNPKDDSGRIRISVGTIAPRPPRLRDLIKESGILEELERDEDLRSILDEEVDGFSTTWSSTDKGTSSSVDSALRDVMDEVLTMDDQQPLPCTCSDGQCIYHPALDGESSFSQDVYETVSIPSRQSKASSFEEIPHYCTPQFEPQYLTPMKIASSHSKFAETSPPKVEASQPSRSIVEERTRASGRPPLSVEASKRRPNHPIKRQQFSPEEADDIMNSSHIPHHISRQDSTVTYHTMVSEITLPYEMASPFRPLHFMRLDPRAPQFQMAREQEKQTRDVTVRTKNHSIMDESDLMPPARRPTPEGETPDPPIRKRSTHEGGPNEMHAWSEHSGDFSSDDEEDPPLVDHPIGRRGTIGGASAVQPSSKSCPHGPFTSPVSNGPKTFEMPSTPCQDSNPLLFPGNLLSPYEEPADDTSVNCESIVGPFVSPSAVPRRYRPMPDTPQHDSNPLLFPQGIGYYPPSPAKLPKPPNRAASPASGPQENGSNRLMPPLLLPLETDCDTKTSSISKSQSSGQSSGESARSEERMIRVKLSPRVITYFVDGQERIHTGFYSGAIDMFHRLHGNGAFWFTTGDIYLGQFVEGQMHGIGVMAIRTSDGSRQILRGFFRQNEFVGPGDDTSDDVCSLKPVQMPSKF